MSESSSSSDPRKFLLPGLIALAATVTLFTVALLAVSLGLLPLGTASQPPATLTETPERTATSRTATPTVLPTGAPELPPDVLREMEQIEDQVVALRGLRVSSRVGRRLITSSELAQLVREDLLDDYGQEEARDDALLWALFGWVEPDFDLWSFYMNLYSEQVAGFYDDEDEVMYIVQGRGFEGPERLTYVHEYVHALQDQTYDLSEGLNFNDEVCQEQTDRCSAVQALVEGDATLLEAQWLRTYATEADRAQISAFYESLESPILRGAPAYIQNSFLYPYQAGLEFVAYTFRNGGWAAVDEVYGQPPASTEQIAEPARYPDDDPIVFIGPEIEPDTLGAGWRVLDGGTLGHFNLRMLFVEQLPSEDAQRAADGWAGDRFLSFHNEDTGRSAALLIQSWDTIRDAQEAYLTWRDYGEARIGAREPLGQAYEFRSERLFARLERTSYQTLWIMAPDPETGAALREAVSFPWEPR